MYFAWSRTVLVWDIMEAESDSHPASDSGALGGEQQQTSPAKRARERCDEEDNVGGASRNGSPFIRKQVLV